MSAIRASGGRLRILLVVHGVVTLAAAVVLVVAPRVIPGAVGVPVAPRGELVPHLLAAMEFGATFLSLGATRLTDSTAIRLISMSFVAMHLATCGLEALAYFSGTAQIGVLANLALRLVISVLFVQWGVRCVA